MSDRSYDQYCPVAKALDLIGDRWTILILRELILGPKRFTDLSQRLGNIAPNLLTHRLRKLEANDLVRRRRLPPPAASQIYELTESGHAFEPAMSELARWGTRYMGPIDEGEAFEIDWLIPVLEFYADAEAARGVRETYEFRIEDAVFHVLVDDGTVTIRAGEAPERADLAVETDLATFAGVGFGAITPEDALAAGRSHLKGDTETLDRALNILAPARVLSKVLATK